METDANLQIWRDLIGRDPSKAREEIERHVATAPHDWRALLLLAKALRATGDEHRAVATERRAVAVSAQDPNHRQAIALLQQGKAFEANSLLKQLIDRDPDDIFALVLFGLQASRANQFEIADRHLLHAVSLAPGDAGTRLAMADHFFRSKRFAKALDEVHSLPEEDRRSEAARVIEADCLGEMGDVEQQLALLRQLAKDATNPLAYNLRIGLALRTIGKLEEASKAFRDVIAHAPYEGTSWHNLANLKVEKFSDQDIATLKEGIAKGPSSTENRIRLHFALGKALEDRGDAEAAFTSYDAGNRLRGSIAPYDPRMFSEWVERSQTAFTADFFKRRQGWGDASRDPIFIVGMQRSGSTLVEQILASHPMIEGTAELTELANIVRSLSEAAATRGARYEEELASFDRDRIASIGASYLSDTRVHRRTDRPLFTDKMPNNWLHVSLIKLALPNAKIIDVRRDPMDCCFSNWKQLYARGLDHSNSLETMGRYYADYVALMRHFDDVIPGAAHRIIYEDLIDDVESEARRLLDFLEIDFEPSVLAFHTTDRAVRTISAGQVRQPINRKGVGQWKKFEAWLEPLKDALGDVRENWRA